MIAALQVKKPLKQLIIANDKEEAAYVYNDLQNLLGETKALYYPASSTSPYETSRTQNANIVQRAEVLSELNNKAKKIIVSMRSWKFNDQFKVCTAELIKKKSELN